MTHDERVFELMYSTESRDEMCERVATMEEEVAKLRELLDYMTPIAWYASSESERDRMYELGIEVE